ncbi:MAG: ABC transporter ATP-binding protein [Thermoplasmata archaeon]|nr:ABC transporter ATP-binding protein [Thermoplasmata archaeon]
MSGPLAPTPSGPAPVLLARGVGKVYQSRGAAGGPRVANHDLHLRLDAGEVVALLGPNGAGKTTFLRQVAGQLLPTSGSIVVAGVDIVAEPLEAKRFLSVIPQECQPMQELTVEEQIRGFARLKGVPAASLDATVEEILRDVGLVAERGQIVRELSGGFKRRVLIAVAMASATPRLMLLDEPTTGLDPEARRQVWSVIRGLRRRGLGILLTTHYIEEAEILADRVVIISGGRFTVSGTVEEIRNRLPYRGRLIVLRADRLTAAGAEAVRALETRWRVTLREPSTIWFEVPDPFDRDTVGELARLASLGVQASLRPVSLEDAYLTVVGTPEALV